MTLGYPGKRLIDLALVVVSAPLWAPLLALAALVVRVGIGSPVFFRQRRPGLHGRPFELVKLRTMTDRRDAQGALLPDAERLTRVGRALRASSLDELPELLNVLRGEMSLVGPRPLLVDYLPLYSERQRRRHDVLPGITGLAQSSGRNALSWAERLELDVQYVERCGFLLDARILLRTVSAVFRRQGISAAGEATMSRFNGAGTPRGEPRD